ncbi:hypothetical protein [Paracoccus sp. T5]|uniref:hypothetical protein n=1 Tax=Paracoccus sp. T5 TaxID=3402161 RepID=UPI003ADF1505
MLTRDDLTNDSVDITEKWCAATGETDCQATAFRRGGLVATVIVRSSDSVFMCRSAVAAILSPDVLSSIET